MLSAIPSSILSVASNHSHSQIRLKTTAAQISSENRVKWYAADQVQDEWTWKSNFGLNSDPQQLSIEKKQQQQQNWSVKLTADNIVSYVQKCKQAAAKDSVQVEKDASLNSADNSKTRLRDVSAHL